MKNGLSLKRRFVAVAVVVVVDVVVVVVVDVVAVVVAAVDVSSEALSRSRRFVSMTNRAAAGEERKTLTPLSCFVSAGKKKKRK